MAEKGLYLLVVLALLASPALPREKSAATPQRLYPVVVGGKTGFVDATGRIVLEPRFVTSISTQGFSEGLLPVRIEGQWSYVDQTGAIVLRTRFDDLGPFAKGLTGITTGSS